MREVIQAYQTTVAAEIARFEGHVAKFMGDGVLAYFGWPMAHEDAAGTGGPRRPGGHRRGGAAERSPAAARWRPGSASRPGWSWSAT